jgi:hypothetical protein
MVCWLKCPNRHPRSIDRKIRVTVICLATLPWCWPSVRAWRPERSPPSSSQRYLQTHWLIRCDIAGPGFINFFINPGHHTEVVRAILESGAAYGRN